MNPSGPVSFSLADAPAGTSLCISGVDDDAGLERRLLELGLPRGAELLVVKRLGGRNGPLVIATHGARLAMGAAMARHIRVTAPLPQAAE